MASRALLSAFFARPSWCMALLVLGTSSACGTDAVGVGACREVEQARCRAAASCGLIEDVVACERYYRDHCLHGVLLESAPRASHLRACVETIESAGRCADRNGPNTEPAECGSERLSNVDTPNVCDVVEAPERAAACAFLEPDPEEPDEDEDDEGDAPNPKPSADADADAG